MLRGVLISCRSGSRISDRDIRTIKIEQFKQMMASESEWEKEGPTILGSPMPITSWYMLRDGRISFADRVQEAGCPGYENVYDFRAGYELWEWEKQHPGAGKSTSEISRRWLPPIRAAIAVPRPAGADPSQHRGAHKRSEPIGLEDRLSRRRDPGGVRCRSVLRGR